MKIRKITVVYFSATYTTRKTVMALAESFGCEVTETDVTDSMPEPMTIAAGDGNLLIAGMPVYAGRIPQQGARALRMIKGGGTPAIAVCVYGNRDYDDALLEMCDLLAEGGFRTIAAAAFKRSTPFSRSSRQDGPTRPTWRHWRSSERRAGKRLRRGTKATARPCPT